MHKTAARTIQRKFATRWTGQIRNAKRPCCNNVERWAEGIGMAVFSKCLGRLHESGFRDIRRREGVGEGKKGTRGQEVG